MTAIEALVWASGVVGAVRNLQSGPNTHQVGDCAYAVHARSSATRDPMRDIVSSACRPMHAERIR